MLGIILLLIMLQDFLPEAHPTIPTLGLLTVLTNKYLGSRQFRIISLYEFFYYNLETALLMSGLRTANV